MTTKKKEREKKEVTPAQSKKIAKKVLRAHERKPVSKGGHGM